MDLPEAVKTGFRKYSTFSGRASRSEFWFWVLFAILGGCATALIDTTLFGAQSLFYGLFGLAIFLPYISVTVRRLHDTDRSGWWWWLWLVPLVGWVILIVWYCTKGTTGPNRFGADPL